MSSGPQWRSAEVSSRRIRAAARLVFFGPRQEFNAACQRLVNALQPRAHRGFVGKDQRQPLAVIVGEVIVDPSNGRCVDLASGRHPEYANALGVHRFGGGGQFLTVFAECRLHLALKSYERELFSGRHPIQSIDLAGGE